ncbi:MAG TPA: AAA family ATPase, partial [Pilimelia sp.]|nr:AAA family ATPase [Pilimelia sp.]
MAGQERFVGRQDELSVLSRRLADARTGAGGVVLVSGPAGIGKTRLVEEFLATVDGVAIGWGTAAPDAGMPALWPWTRALRGMPGPRATLAALVAGDTQREYGSADEAAAATFAADTAVVDALEERARAGAGMLLVLDDLHWADHATLRLLRRVEAEVRRLPLLLIATHRDGAGEALVGHRSGATEELRLGPLDRADASRLLSVTVERADPVAVRRAVELSGGSPLYLRTLGRVAAEQLRGRGSWDDTVGAAPEFRTLVAAALRAAGPAAVVAVEALSVLGADAEPDVVAHLIGEDTAGAAIERLLPAVPAGLVEVGAPPGFRVRFAHALVRDAAYASLPPQRRVELHRRAAEVLEPWATGRDERAGAVARHWVLAGEPGRAVTWAVRAAEAARAAGGYDDAAAYLELALDATDRAGAGIEGDRAELLLDLGRVQYLGGKILPSLHTCGRAADEGERVGRADVVARAAITVQGIGHPDANVQIVDLCRRALAMFDDGAMPNLRARVQAQLACALIELDAIDEAARWSRHALATAEASGDPDAELDAIHARVMLAWRPTEDDEVHALGGRAIELAEATRRPLARLWGHVWRSDCAVRRADLNATWVEVAGMQALADRTGLPLVRWHLLRRQASLAALAGNFDGCRRLAGEAVAVAESWHDMSGRFTHLGQTVCLAMLRGDPTDLDPAWTEFVADIDRQPSIGRAVIAAALLLVGERDRARALYEPLVASLKDARTHMEAACVTYLIHLAPAFDDVASCIAIRDWLIAMAGGSPALGAGVVFYLGSVARVLGQLDL